MKKLITLIALLLVVFISGFFVYKNWQKGTEIKVVETPEIVLEQEEAVALPDSFEIKTLNPIDPYVSFDVKYPSFKKADSEFNLSIEKFIKDVIQEHSQISKDNWQSRYDTQTEGENIPRIPKENEKFSFFSDFTIIQSNSSYISFILKYGGFSGGAHGYENNISFNYDLKNHKILKLADLFPNDPDYLTYLSDQSRLSLIKTFATLDDANNDDQTPEDLEKMKENIISDIESGTEPTEDNFSVFTFTPDKVTIYFGQYQVGPYTFGSPEVEIGRK